MSKPQQIAVVTGTSTGIGLSTSVHLARNGYQVFAGMRNLAKADALREAAEGLPVQIVELDVNEDESVATAFAQVQNVGPIDVLVNNAGLGGATPLELTPLAEHKSVFETNYFGAVRCIQAVLPQMREAGRGAIANITSIEGRLAVPNQVAYSASKWALECLGEALAHEVYSFGVRVVNIEPGVIMTSIFDNSAELTRYDRNSPYQPIMRRNGKMFAAGFKQATQPELVAETILEAVTTEDYKLRWPVGPDAHSMIEGRGVMSDEAWVEMGGPLEDADYNERYERHFDIKL